MDKKNWICKYIYDILIPNSCPCCEKFIKWNKLICEDCEENLPFINVSFCEKCGRVKCCDHEMLNYDGVVSIMFFDGICKDMIYSLKHSGQVNNFAEYCAVKICEKIEKMEMKNEIDLVTCVPMNVTKRFNRGYNQSKIFAEYVRKHLKKPKDYKLLLHKKDLTEQHILKGADRKAHADSVYYPNCNHEDVEGKTILICDDVFTTGSTMNSCASLLKGMGAKKVYCAVISITKFGI